MESVDQLAKKAFGLQPAERIRLVEAILFSLDKPDPNIEQSWVAESESRYEAYKRGELGVVNWDSIKKKTRFLREKLEKERELILTKDGEPFALIIGIPPENVERSLAEIHR